MDTQHSSQNPPRREAMSAEALRAMSPEQLTRALEETLDAMTDETYDPEVLDAYLDALDQKAPMPQPPDPEEALRALQAQLSPAPPAKTRPLRRALVAVAAAAALLFTLLVGAQAAGVDLFGSLARWTGQLFHFLPAWEAPRDQGSFAAFRQALRDRELPPDLAPTWCPEGFTPREPQFWDDDMGAAVQVTFTNGEGRSFAVSVEYYHDPNDITAFAYEKDGASVEEYIQNGRRFYILSNVNSVSAVWADGNYSETIIGRLSVDEIKQIIDSIGG